MGAVKRPSPAAVKAERKLTKDDAAQVVRAATDAAKDVASIAAEVAECVVKEAARVAGEVVKAALADHVRVVSADVGTLKFWLVVVAILQFVAIVADFVRPH